MYEMTNPSSKWGPYLNILQKEYDTPMFWTQEEVEECKGSGVFGMFFFGKISFFFNEV